VTGRSDCVSGTPPHVAYQLTPMGKTLLPATAPLIESTAQHLAGIDRAREGYDTRTKAQSLAVAR
jgi:DNA-binding HxlR family transcriptional regulator